MTIRGWWRQWPAANVGLALPPGLQAVDADGETGEATLRGLGIPLTPCAETGGGGLHALFALPQDVAGSKKCRVAPGLDLRGAGSYLVAPPSLHRSGRLHQWPPGLAPDDADPAPAPAWLVDLLASAGEGEPILDGCRNTTLFPLACRWRREGEGAEALLAGLLEVNAKCVPPETQGYVTALAERVAATYPVGPDAGLVRVPRRVLTSKVSLAGLSRRCRSEGRGAGRRAGGERVVSTEIPRNAAAQPVLAPAVAQLASTRLKYRTLVDGQILKVDLTDDLLQTLMFGVTEVLLEFVPEERLPDAFAAL